MKKPVKLLPAFKDYLWGGDRLKKEFNKKTDMDIVAESWELSTHKDGQSIVATGEYKGMLFGDYIKNNPYDVIGKKAREFEFFPILIKFIDAKDNLSIQVHPDDEYSLRVNGEYGKTEMWYILDCEENSYLYYGFNKKISKEEFKERIENNTLLEVLNKVNVKKGDVFFIEAGTVHAICKGIVICEIQQNSNTTYRVYDYNRKSADGKPRELHIEKALEVSKTEPGREFKKGNDNVLASCKYFTVEKYDISDELEIDITLDSFKSIIITEGSGSIICEGEKIDFIRGDSIFVPSQDSKAKIKGKCEIIVSYV